MSGRTRRCIAGFRNRAGRRANGRRGDGRRRYLRRQPSSPALATMAATGGISPAHTEIATAAVTENNRTTVQAKMTATMQPPIRTKYARSRFIARSSEVAALADLPNSRILSAVLAADGCESMAGWISGGEAAGHEPQSIGLLVLLWAEIVLLARHRALLRLGTGLIGTMRRRTSAVSGALEMTCSRPHAAWRPPSGDSSSPSR